MQMYRSEQGGGISVSWKSRSHFAGSFGNAGNSRHFQGCQLFFRQPCSLITVQHFVVHTSIIHIDAPKWHLGYGYKRFHSNRVEHGNEPIFSHFQTVQQGWIRKRPYPQHICVHSLDDPRNQEHERGSAFSGALHFVGLEGGSAHRENVRVLHPWTKAGSQLEMCRTVKQDLSLKYGWFA